MSYLTYCLLTQIQVSQEACKVVWYSHIFKNFPQFVVIHTVKGFSVVNEAEVDVFLKFPCSLHEPMNVGSLISGSFASSKLSLYIWKFSLYVPLKSSLKDFEHYLASMWNESNCTAVWILFSIALLWDWIWKKHFFPVLWSLLSFPNLLVFWVQHFHSIIY